MSVETPIVQSRDERFWGMLCHLSALLGLFTVFGFVLGPLVVWLVKKDQYPFVNDQGKESINFQISMLIYAAISAVLMIIVIGFLLLAVVAIVDIVLVVIASIAASEGRPYRYPLAIRFVK